MSIKIKQDPEAPVPTEIIADGILAISQGVKKLLDGRLNERAVVLLITEATPTLPGYPPKQISAKTVKAVLQGITQLEREYIKPKKP